MLSSSLEGAPLMWISQYTPNNLLDQETDLIWGSFSTTDENLRTVKCIQKEKKILNCHLANNRIMYIGTAQPTKLHIKQICLYR